MGVFGGEEDGGVGPFGVPVAAPGGEESGGDSVVIAGGDDLVEVFEMFFVWSGGVVVDEGQVALKRLGTRWASFSARAQNMETLNPCCWRTPKVVAGFVEGEIVGEVPGGVAEPEPGLVVFEEVAFIIGDGDHGWEFIGGWGSKRVVFFLRGVGRLHWWLPLS